MAPGGPGGPRPAPQPLEIASSGIFSCNRNNFYLAQPEFRGQSNALQFPGRALGNFIQE